MGAWSDRFAKVRPYLPWVSLGTGIASALIMNRSPGRAWIVVVASLLAWTLLLVLASLDRRTNVAASGAANDAANGAAKGGRARFFVLLLSQMSIQQALLFPLPFYLRAATLHPRHAAFFAAYALALAATLWDPLYERTTKRRATAIALFSFAAFVGLAMVLPVLGLSNRHALVVAGVGAALGVPVALAAAPRQGRRALHGLGALAAMAVVVVGARLLAFLVPPAPLELVSCVIGTGVVDREPVGMGERIPRPGQLVCHSAIKAPLGLKDALVHRWAHDGRTVSTVPLDVSGGREAGFRTWSRKSAPPRGSWTCTVETATGQVLGAERVVVE